MFNIVKITFFISLSIVLNYVAISQNQIIKGNILDANNNAIPYASIEIFSKKVGTISNNKGCYKIDISTCNANDTVKISALGYQTINITISNF